MYPILGRYGPFFLYSFTVVMGLGLAAGIGLSAWFVKNKQDKQANSGWMDGLLVSLPLAFIGGRICFVWANWSYFQERPDEIALVWQGGLSYHGALIVGLPAFWLWTIWRRRKGTEKLSFTSCAALLMPGFVLAHLFGWTGCWLEGCAFGRETVLGWLAADLPDSFGVFAVRYQSQLLGFGLTAVIFIVVLVLRNRSKEGPFFWLAFGLLSMAYGFVTLVRGDSVPLVGSLRLDTLISTCVILVSLIGFIIQKVGQFDKLSNTTRHES
jgi:phosphatidylglycerol:prolipoprotein diacylglycerol transferase